MCHIIEMTYKSKAKYRFSNIQIANCLCFTEEDIANSWCNFSAERKKEAKKIRNHNTYEKKRTALGKPSPKEKEKLNLEYLRAHPDISAKDGMAALGVGRTTFFELKSKLKEMADEKISDN